MSEQFLKKLLLLAALAAQVPHAAGLFYMISPESGGGWWDVLSMTHAFLYAIALEGAVYYFVLRGHQGYSWGFAAASVATNMLYFWHEDGMTGLYIARFALTSVMLPFAIALYSHDNVEDAALTVERSWQESEEEAVPHVINQVVPEVQPVGGILPTWLTQEVEVQSISPAKAAKVKMQAGEHVCRCGKSFSSGQALGGHARSCNQVALMPALGGD